MDLTCPSMYSIFINFPSNGFIIRRMFRSQTSDSLDRWKAEMGRVREKRRVEERRSEERKSQKKEDAGARKGRKVAKNCVVSKICGSGGSKSRLAKAAGAEPSGQMRDEKLHAVVARSTFRSQNVQNTPCSDHCSLLEVEMSKKCTRLWREAHLQVKKLKHLTFGPLLEVEMSKKCTPLWREAHFEVKMYKTHHAQTTFGSWDVEKVHAVVARSTFRSQNVQKHHMFAPLLDVQVSFCVAGARDCAPCQKWAKREGFVTFPKTMAGVGHLNRILKDAFSVAGTVQETWSSELLGGPGADFLRKVAFWSLKSSGLLRWFCVTSAALRMTWHHFFVAGAVVQTNGLEKNRKTRWYEAVSAARNFPFLKEVLQNCFVFDVVNFEKWRSLAELLRFWRCQVEILRKSCRIASFLMLSTLKNDEVSQNCLVFDVVKFKH